MENSREKQSPQKCMWQCGVQAKGEKKKAKQRNATMFMRGEYIMLYMFMLSLSLPVTTEIEDPPSPPK